MTSTDSERLADYVRSLPDFEHFKTIDGHYDHIGAIAADAILQANMRYATHVRPRVRRILKQYPDARTTSAVRSVLESIPASEFLGWKGKDRIERFCEILELLDAEDIETEADFRAWLSYDKNLPKLHSIKGIGPKTLDYMKILVGHSTVAIDRHLLHFLKNAGLNVSSYIDAQTTINEAADILAVDRAHFDHSIWQYMSKKLATTPVQRCRVNDA